MGTGFDVNVDRDLVGIIPRAVEHLFNGIDERRKEALNAGRPLPDFSIKAQFIEVYIYIIATLYFLALSFID